MDDDPDGVYFPMVKERPGSPCQDALPGEAPVLLWPAGSGPRAASGCDDDGDYPAFCHMTVYALCD